MAEAPLKGYKIIDLSHYGTGRYCTMLLADFGAEVITIETPRSGTFLPALLTDDTSPGCGEHTIAILKEQGNTEEEIQELRRNKIVD